MNSDGSNEAFSNSLERRRKAAKGLEHDLLTDVPMMYGSPDNLAANGDAGIILAAIHRDELQRRNGGGMPPSYSKEKSDNALPFEHAVMAMAVLGALVLTILR